MRMKLWPISFWNVHRSRVFGQRLASQLIGWLLIFRGGLNLYWHGLCPWVWPNLLSCIETLSLDSLSLCKHLWVYYCVVKELFWLLTKEKRKKKKITIHPLFLKLKHTTKIHFPFPLNFSLFYIPPSLSCSNSIDYSPVPTPFLSLYLRRSIAERYSVSLYYIFSFSEAISYTYYNLMSV